MLARIREFPLEEQRAAKQQVEVLGGDMADADFRRTTCPRIAYMPQGLGKNLYPTLSAFENLDFFGRLFGATRAERRSRIVQLLLATGLLASFTLAAVQALARSDALSEQRKADIALGFQAAVVDVLVAKAIAARRRFYVLPWQMAVAGRALRALPRPLYDRMFASAPRKPPTTRIRTEPVRGRRDAGRAPARRRCRNPRS